MCSTCQGAQGCTFGVCGSGGLGGGTGGSSGGGTGGSSGGGAGGGGGSTPVLQFCLDAVALQVEFYAMCGTYSAAGVAELRSQQEARCATSGLSRAYADGRATFDATMAARCLAGLRDATCTVSNPPGYYDCTRVFPGAVGVNGLCFGTDECTSALYCDTSTTCPGRCVARVALGQPVTAPQQCVANAEPYGGLCAPLIALGQSCAPTGGNPALHQCVEGGVCGPADQCITWTATVLQGNGQACNNTTGLECGQGLNCVANVCTPYVTAGNPCDTVRGCQQDLRCNASNTCVVRSVAGATCSTSECASSLFCNKPTGSTTGTCTPLRTVDQTCTNGSACVPGLFCTATSTAPGVCKAPYAIGATCTYNPAAFTQCGPGYCTATSTSLTGVCANKKITGATCVSYEECQGACVSGRCTAPSYCYDAAP